MNNLTREDFIKLDTLDPIKKAREEFALPKTLFILMATLWDLSLKIPLSH